jgi:ADP-heptose:LPS heptosyltransferase
MKKRLLKALDTGIGPVFVRCSPRRAREAKLPGGANQPLAAGDVRSILVVRPGGIGDAILSLPLLSALREKFPEARVDILAERRNAPAYEIEESPSRVYRYDEEPLRTFRTLAAARYDLVVDTEQAHRLSTVAVNFLAPRYLCGFDSFGRGRLLTHAARYDEGTYEVLSFLSLLGALTGETPRFDADAPFLHPAPRWRAWAQGAVPSGGDRPMAAFMPVAGNPHRLWPPARFAAVGEHLCGKGFDIVLLGGPDAAAAAGEIEAALPAGRVVNLVGRHHLGQTAAALERTKLCLTPDTSVLHLAYAVGVPTVSLFGSSNAAKWAPPGRRHIAIDKRLSCGPCTKSARTPPCAREYECMMTIGVDEVIAAIERLLSGKSP